VAAGREEEHAYAEWTRPMTELATFLLARFDEDAAAARQGSDRGATGSRQVAPHRTRALVECEEKRRIVERFLAIRKHWLETRVTEHHVGRQHLDQARRGGEVDGLWHAMTHLALVHAHHEDYRPEWRPSG
jgi:hypothetical protein